MHNFCKESTGGPKGQSTALAMNVVSSCKPDVLPFQYNVDSNGSLNMQKLHGAGWDSHSGDNCAYQFNEE